MTTLLTDEQCLLRDSVRDLLAAEFPIASTRHWLEADPDEQGRLASAAWQRFAEQGWLGVAWPESCGGAGLGLVEQCLVLCELGRVLRPSGYLSTLVAGTILLEAGEDATATALSEITAGGRICAVVPPAQSATLEFEPGDGTGSVQSPDGGCEVRLSAREGGSVLDGESGFVAEAVFADSLLVAAAESEGGWSWALVSVDAPGVRREERETMDGTRPLSRVVFDGAPVQRVGAAGAGAALWAAAAPVWWLALAAESVGASEQVLADSVAYAKEREQFGRPIGVNQAIQHRCADMFVRAEGARAITWHAARELDAGAPGARSACSMAKAYATEAGLENARDGIQIHGGVGFTWEFDCHFFYKRARASEITAGHPDEHREAVAREAGL